MPRPGSPAGRRRPVVDKVPPRQTASKARALAGPFEIGGLRVRRGERIQFDLPVAQLYTHTPLDMSV